MKSSLVYCVHIGKCISIMALNMQALVHRRTVVSWIGWQRLNGISWSCSCSPAVLLLSLWITAHISTCHLLLVLALVVYDHVEHSHSSRKFTVIFVFLYFGLLFFFSVTIFWWCLDLQITNWLINVSWADKWTDAGHWKTSNPSGYSGGEREGIKKGKAWGIKMKRKKKQERKKKEYERKGGRRKKQGKVIINGG